MAEKAEKKPNIFVRMGRAFARIGRGVSRFFRDTKGEMKKVVWPSRKQVINNFFVVMGFVILAAALIYGLDILLNLLYSKGINLLSGLKG